MRTHVSRGKYVDSITNNFHRSVTFKVGMRVGSKQTQEATTRKEAAARSEKRGY